MTTPSRLLRLAVTIASLAVVTAPLAARAQVSVGIQIGLPVAPPMVVIQPGVQVVENYHEEVFFTGGWYWVRRGPYWYRAPRPGATFVMVEQRRVPPGLMRLPPGHYKHWHKEEMKEARRHEKAERKAWKQSAKEEHGHGHGHGHGHDD